MKKRAVFTIVTCSIAVLFLSSILFIGLKSDGFGLFHPRGETPGEKKNEYTYTWDPREDGVDGLSVEWVSGSVNLKVGSGDVIRITERSSRALDEKEKLKLSSSGGTLKIVWSDRFLFFPFFQSGEKDLTVEVPKAVAEALEDLSCSTVSGTVSAAGLTAGDLDFSTTSGDMDLTALSGKNLDISTTSGVVECGEISLSERLSASSTSGSLRFRGCQADKTELNTVSGEVSYEGKAERVGASSVSAAIRAELENCPAEAEMDSVSGRLTLVIPENDGFETEYDSISGTFHSDFPVTGGSGKSGRALYAGGKASFEFSTTSGDMEILKK